MENGHKTVFVFEYESTVFSRQQKGLTPQVWGLLYTIVVTYENIWL